MSEQKPHHLHEKLETIALMIIFVILVAWNTWRLMTGDVVSDTGKGNVTVEIGIISVTLLYFVISSSVYVYMAYKYFEKNSKKDAEPVKFEASWYFHASSIISTVYSVGSLVWVIISLISANSSFSIFHKENAPRYLAVTFACVCANLLFSFLSHFMSQLRADSPKKKGKKEEENI